MCFEEIKYTGKILFLYSFLQEKARLSSNSDPTFLIFQKSLEQKPVEPGNREVFIRSFKGEISSVHFKVTQNVYTKAFSL